jgi:alpha-galactosidase
MLHEASKQRRLMEEAEVPITFHESSKVFHLSNKDFSYIFCVLGGGQLGQLYYGAPLRDRDDFDHMLTTGGAVLVASPYEDRPDFGMEDVKQEYPVHGNGDLRPMACTITAGNGSTDALFTYVSHTIAPGKPVLEGLPATYVEDASEAETLSITLHDEVLGADMVLSYTVYEGLPVLARSARIVNTGDAAFTIDSAMSISLDLPDADYDMMEFTGAWARERRPRRQALHPGTQSIYSMRGHSSQQFNPFLVLARPDAGEDSGDVIGVSLVYSGNFLAQVDVDNYHVARLMMGIHPEGFCWKLDAGQSFQTPEAVMVFSRNGLNSMSQSFHTLLRTRLARGYWRDRPRPILLNSWESTYMDFDESKLLTLAGAAKNVGIDLFVLDDGWFGTRDDDTTSLGDWTPDLRKLPEGISGLARKVTDLGIDFGLWIEPEMISKNSDLYRAHPDWLLHTPGRKPLLGRNQYVLDLSRSEVRDYILNAISELLASAKISYIKWDMNRSMTDVYSVGLPPEQQGEVYHRQILAVYSIYEQLTARFPHVLFESCASGGARFDPGMLYYAPQAWTSDDTDAAERIKIQYGTSYLYPLSSMGSHVSAVPNHQLHRSVPMQTRANVAYFGTFGYELDITKLSDEEQQQVREQIAFMKQHQELISAGSFYRLISPFEPSSADLMPNSEAAWMVVSNDHARALVGYYRMAQPVNEGLRSLKLAGLNPGATYRITCPDSSLRSLDYTYYGDELMERGFDISATGFRPAALGEYQGDYLSYVFEVTQVE